MSAAAFIALTAEQRRHFDWLDAPHLAKIINALDEVEPGAARYVGGCVRDSLLEERPKDVDIATLLPPDKALSAVKAAGLGAAPTGIDHGTITAIADHQGVEITTLRADVSTDGRRASVAFTRDWATDAGRRDFRVNAIYLTPDGRLYDPVGGLEDIAAKRVRFIGDPEQRIREDYLRILRFFRFTARLSDSFDQAGLEACAKLKDGIGRLSAERIGAETMAILSLPCATMALEAMQNCGVLAEIWNAPAFTEVVRRLKGIAPDVTAPVVLAALYGDAGDGIGARLRLSNAEKSIRSKALKGAALIAPELDEVEARVLVYKLGKDVFHDAIAIACARSDLDSVAYGRLLGFADNWTPPDLPVSGKHILAAGVTPGPAVAAILSEVERQWIDEGFPERARVNEIVNETVAARR
jgi:poly(A) polymerase